MVVFKAKDSIEAALTAKKALIFSIIFETEPSSVLISWCKARLVGLVVAENLISVTIILISSNVSLTVCIAETSFLILRASETVAEVSEHIEIIEEPSRLSMRGIIAVSCPVEVTSVAWVPLMPGLMSVIEAKIRMTYSAEIILLLTENSILII